MDFLDAAFVVLLVPVEDLLSPVVRAPCFVAAAVDLEARFSGDCAALDAAVTLAVLAGDAFLVEGDFDAPSIAFDALPA